MSAGRLFEIARVLNAPITYFYEGLGRNRRVRRRRISACCSRSPAISARSRTKKHQEAVSQLARALGRPLTGRDFRSAPAAAHPRAPARRVCRQPGGYRSITAGNACHEQISSAPIARVEAIAQPQQRRPFALPLQAWHISGELGCLPLASLCRWHDHLAAPAAAAWIFS